MFERVSTETAKMGFPFLDLPVAIASDDLSVGVGDCAGTVEDETEVEFEVLKPGLVVVGDRNSVSPL